MHSYRLISFDFYSQTRVRSQNSCAILDHLIVYFVKKHTRCIWFTHGLRLYLKTCKIQDGVSQINSLSKGAMTKTVVPKNVQYYSFNVEQWDRVDPLYLAMALFLLSRSKQVDHILT